jgi:hypothetical protein
MRNLPFWTRFFQLTLGERMEAARKLITAIHPDDEGRRAGALGQMEQCATKFVKEQENFSDVYCVFQEERHTELAPEERLEFNPKYFRQEALAVARLLSSARASMEKKNYTEAIQALDAVQLSDVRVRQAHAMMAECLRACGRNAEAEVVRLENLAVWPPMNAVRRGFRFLGMVANDAKRMLVGMTEKGKKGG